MRVDHLELQAVELQLQAVDHLESAGSAQSAGLQLQAAIVEASSTLTAILVVCSPHTSSELALVLCLPPAVEASSTLSDH